MLSRILALAVLALALAAPAALAANGAPTQPGQQSPAAAGARQGNGPGQLEQRLAEMRQRLERAGAMFARYCESGRADTTKCTAAAQKLLAALQKIDSRIDGVIAKINDRCSGGPTQQPGGSQAVPRACAHAQQLVKLLQDVQAKIRQFEQKLQAWLANPPARSTGGSQPGGSTGGSAGAGGGSGTDSLPGLDQLAADLATARAAAAQSGL